MSLHHWRCYKATRKARCSRRGGLCSCEATNCTSNLGHQCPREVRNGSKTKPESTLAIYKNRLEICLVLSTNRKYITTVFLIFSLMESLDDESKFWDFPGNPVVKTPHFHYWGHGFSSWLGNYNPTCHVVQSKIKISK